ncbi:MAG: hypothetical protein ACERKO_02600 [Acetanaerobacterium sp.]
MKLLMKQLRYDSSTMLFETLKLCGIVPLMFIILSLSDNVFGNPQSYIIMMIALALPAGILTLSMTRLTTTIHTSLSMGSTRKAFYLSNLICSLILYLLLTVVSLVLTGAVLLSFDSVRGTEFLKLAFSPALIGGAFSIDTLAFGVGTLTGGLVCRFGRKVYIIMLVVLMVAGGVAGGTITMVSFNNQSGFSWSNHMLVIAAVSAFALGLALYGIGWRIVKKYYVG